MVDKLFHHVNTGEFPPIQSECGKCDTTPISKLRAILAISMKPERATHSANNERGIRTEGSAKQIPEILVSQCAPATQILIGQSSKENKLKSRKWK
jgi:hypothetical protein